MAQPQNQLNSLIYKNVVFFKRYYLLVATAAVITVAVITGSLMIGDSVRATLIKRVEERLGNTETIIFSRNSFLDEKILETSVLNNGSRGILLTNGFVSHNGKLIPVFVWGVDDMPINKGAARINKALFNEMGATQPDAFVLRLPASGLVPSGSLFVTKNYTTGLRLDFDGIVNVKEGGNISLKNEQTIPLNIFVNRSELTEIMQIERKINLILADKTVSAAELEQAWDYSISGLSVERRNIPPLSNNTVSCISTKVSSKHQDISPSSNNTISCISDNYEKCFTEITSDRIFLQKDVVESICSNNHAPNRLFSYLANSIERLPTGQDVVSTSGGQEIPIEQNIESIPYSFVTAMDQYDGDVLQPDEIILSDYSANRLHVQKGDRVKITYFISKDLKTLQTRALSLSVKKIIPLSEISTDPTLSADFPGLTDAESCTDWNSDLPINMDLITKEDERYWELYRSVPKAIIAYNAVAGDWSNEYGSATAIRLYHTPLINEKNDVRLTEEPDLSKLRAGMFGIQLIYPRAAGFYSAKSGVDFAGLFLALGFFIILSAILLMIVPLSEMFYQRRHEFSLLKALGYPQKRIIRLLWRESAPVIFTASVAGVIAGIIYTSLVMWLLGNLWKGATHTDGFTVYPDIITLIIGSFTGFVLSFGILFITITHYLKREKAGEKSKSFSIKKRKMFTTLSVFIAISLTVISYMFINEVILFVITGVTILITASVAVDYLICKNGAVFTGGFNAKKLIWGALYANKKQAMLSFLALSTGVFIVFSVGLNRKGFENSSQLRTGTGGYTLWCESAVPVYHNMMTREGRGKLSLTDLPDETEILQCLRLSADDASCLNLNKAVTPTVLGVDLTALSGSDFQVEKKIYSLEGAEIYKRLQTCADSVFPALTDAAVLTWSLGLKLGDTLYYENGRGQKVAIQLAGTLPNTVFQGFILIDKRFFTEIWEETTGSEVFLLKTGDNEKEEVKTLLSQALNEYGVRVTTTNDRLKQFNSVSDAYLSIFLTLGGLGLLLGIMSFVIVIRKNLASRHNEIDLYKALGFTNEKIEQTLCKENRIIPLYAIATGIISSLAGIGVNFKNTGTGVWIIAILFTILFVLYVILFVKSSVKNKVRG